MAKNKINIPDPCLVSLTKNNETIHAHPQQVDLWVSQGWLVVQNDDQDEMEEDDAKRLAEEKAAAGSGTGLSEEEAKAVNAGNLAPKESDEK